MDEITTNPNKKKRLFDYFKQHLPYVKELIEKKPTDIEAIVDLAISEFKSPDGNLGKVKIQPIVDDIKDLYLKIASFLKNDKVTSFGFFTKADFVNRYKLAKARSKKIRRSTPLPKDFIEWCLENHPDIFSKQELSNWNDLNGLVTHVKSYGLDNVEGYVIEEAVNRGMIPKGPSYRLLEE